MSSAHPEYFLGHSDPELERLVRQSSFYGDLTEYTLRRAGLGPGMRVLDVGCGPGDVSFLAASIVGPTGGVLGVDRSAEAVTVARTRAEQARVRHVTFEQADVTTLPYRGEFDAVIGRLVLLYLGDPQQAMRAFASYAKPGALVYFQEFVRPGMKSQPTVELWDRTVEHIEAAAGVAGIDLYMGMRVAALMRGAGLPHPSMLGMGRIEGGEASPAYTYLAETLRSLLPILERAGKVNRDALDMDTLAERMRVQAVLTGATVCLPILNAAWTRVPA